jgi:hypothetical protein
MTKQSKFSNCFIPGLLILTVLLAFPRLLFAEDNAKNNNSPQDSSPQQISNAQEKPAPYSDADISVKVIPSANKTYGYDILLYGRPLVHQPNIPGLPGNKGFTTKKRARTVANYVVKKIRNNEMPPTVTIEDLNKMDVLK